jgi:DNA-binding XRE family transcriptional regulator
MNTQTDNSVEFNHKAWAEALPKHVSRRQLAKEIGTTDSNLISIEKGLTKPSIMLAFKYCLATRLPLEELCLRK